MCFLCLCVVSDCFVSVVCLFFVYVYLCAYVLLHCCSTLCVRACVIFACCFHLCLFIVICSCGVVVLCAFDKLFNYYWLFVCVCVRCIALYIFHTWCLLLRLLHSTLGLF